MKLWCISEAKSASRFPVQGTARWNVVSHGLDRRCRVDLMREVREGHSVFHKSGFVVARGPIFRQSPKQSTNLPYAADIELLRAPTEPIRMMLVDHLGTQAPTTVEIC